LASKWVKVSREEALGIAQVCQFRVAPNRCTRKCEVKGESHVCCAYCHLYVECEHGVFCPTLEKLDLGETAKEPSAAEEVGEGN